MIYLPALFEDDWRNEVLNYAFDKRKHPKQNFYAEEKDRLTVIQFCELYYSRWSLPENDWYPPTIT